VLLKGASCHFPQFEVDRHIDGGWRRLGEWWKSHLYHARPEFSCIIKLAADIFSYLSGCLGEGILSGHHIIDGVLDLTTLPFELDFAIAAATVLVTLSLVRLGGGGIPTVTGSSGWGACIARHPFVPDELEAFVVRKC
jgi:hypothetical protein